MNLAREPQVRHLRPVGEWALVDWVHEEDIDSSFSSTLEAVIAVLRERGPLKRSELIRRVIDVYPVSPWAILNALESEQVGTTSERTWDLVERGARPIGPKPQLNRPSSVSESPDGRSLTFTKEIDSEMLRGSGLAVKQYVGWRLGLVKPGMNRVFSSLSYPAITVRRSFGSSNVSTLRQQATSLGGRVGQVLSITLDLFNNEYTIGLLEDNNPNAASATTTESLNGTRVD